VEQRAETKHRSVEDKPRDDTGRIQGRQNGKTGTAASPKQHPQPRKVSSGAKFIFTFSDAMG
jgi:hypothetical protein